MPVIFFKYFILIIIVESQYFKDYLLLFARSEAEQANCYNGTKWSDTKCPAYITVIKVKLVNSSNTSRSAFTRALDK